MSPVIEALEGRRFFAATTIQPLPFVLEFDADRGEILDKDGQGTGFTRIQANKLGTQYDPSKLDLDIVTGVLKITTTGDATSGGPYNGDNTLVNGLETQFNATTSGFAITTRLKGPLSFIDNPAEQAGIMFGPDQDNYVKLVAVSQYDSVSKTNKQYLQFLDEQTSGTTYSHALAPGGNTAASLTSIGSFASINTLDLRLVGDAATGKVTAFYAINGGPFVKIGAELTLSGSKKDAFFSTAGRAGIIAMHKNALGPMTATFERFEITAGSTTGTQPSIVASDPANGQINVHRDAAIRNSLYLPTVGAGVDEASLTANTVRLYRTSDGVVVPGSTGTSGGGDVINFAPGALLDANTNYTFVIDGVKDTSGAAFTRYQISFTTGTQSTPVNTNYSFEKVTLNTASGHSYTAVKMGPDGKLYAATLEGLIQRFSINADGTLGAAENITSLQNNEGGNRFLTGIAFDPASTASNLILWVSHSFYALTNAQDWSGKISKLTGANLATVTHVVKNLPRSIRDHTTNQIAFSPVDGKLYFTQGSMSAMGAPDNAWGLRAEHLLSGAVLRLDPSKIAAGTTLDVKTEDGGTYNPFATNAPLTIYGRGVRNAYDLLFHSNGRLYVPTNGSAPGGNTPAGGGAPALNDVREVMNDYLFDVVQGGYYGHPNPLLGHYVLNGGNPTSGTDPGEVTSYPVGTQPDANYRGFAYDFGENQSPNGVIEYRSGGNAFGGTLDGKILVVRYSVGGGQDVIALTLGTGGAITAANVNIPGLTSFNEPLDIEVNGANGFLYVVEYGGKKITLSRPILPGAKAEIDKPKMVFNDPTTSGSQTLPIVVKNTGTGPLVLDTDAFSIAGTDAARWTLPTKPTTKVTLQPGESLTLSVRFTSNSVRIFTATLVVKTSDPNSPTINVPLRGLGTTGTGGSNEPSLQRLLDLHQIPINVGDADPLTTELQTPLTTPNDELVMPRLQRAGSGPVTIEPLAVFGVGHSTLPTLRFGYYTPGNQTDRTELFTVRGTANAQTVAPSVTGNLSFDPGAAAFGLYGLWPSMSTISSSFPQGTETYSEDVLNYELDQSSMRKFRFYAMKNADGSVVPNAYVVAVEEFTGGNYDNQDIVFILRNVKPAASGAEIGYQNLDGAPYNDRMIFNRISNPDPAKPNYVKDIGKIRIRNTGTSDLTINGLTLNNAAWELVNPPIGAFTIGANGGHRDITIRFKATTGSLHNGTLTISSNDADEPTTVIQLAGWRQNRSENNEEPTIEQHLQLLGYTTRITYPGQQLNNGGKVEAVGDEILSPYWKRADTGAPATVRQLSAYHTQGETATVRYHTKGSSTTTTLFTHEALDGQTFFPRISGSLAPAVGLFSHTGTFGFKIDNEWSDPAKNTGSGDPGHHVRFFVAKDRAGNVIPNTYVMVMDYSAINYDYQDNVYLVTNIKPELSQTPVDTTPPAAPSSLALVPSTSGILLDWADNAESDLAGYEVWRASSATGTFAKVSGSALLTTSTFNDTTAPSGQASYYAVYALDASGNRSAALSGNATRPPSTGPTQTPFKGSPFAIGSTPIVIEAEDFDLGGNNVAYFDTDATSNRGGAYRNEGVDIKTIAGTSGQYRISDAIEGEWMEYTVDVAANGQYLAEFRVASRDPGSQFHIEINGVNVTGILTVPDTNSYDVFTTISASLNLAAGEQVIRFVFDAPGSGGYGAAYDWMKFTLQQPQATPPAAPSGLTASGSTSGITLDWANNTEADLAGYNVYRASSAGGTYVKVNTSGLLSSSDFVDANAPAGATSYYRVTAVNGSGLESTPAAINAARPASGPVQTPFKGTPFAIGATPVTIEAEDFDLGGNNVAYFDTDPTSNRGGQYRNEGVDIKTISGTSAQYRISDAIEGEWLEYTAQVASSGTYLMEFRVGNRDPGSTFHVEINGVNISGILSVPDTDSFDVFATVAAAPINLTAGTQVIRFVFDNPGSTGYGAAFDSFKVTQQQVTAPTAPAAPAGLTANGSASGITLDWADNAESDVAGYYVYRSSTAGGNYQLISGSSPIAASNFLDTTAPAGATSYYRVTAASTAPLESSPASASAARPATADTTAPTTPGSLGVTGSTSGISLDWANNAETDLAGYNVYRSDSSSGVYTLVNTGGLLTASAYDDTSMPAGDTRYYKVTAVDSSGNESAQSSAVNATRTAEADPQQPFNGTPFAVGATPVTIQAEDYDLGGQGIAYNDTTTSNIGGKYRTDGVDIKTIAGTTNQYRISDAVDGEWMEYTIDVAADGNYLFEFRVGNRDAGSTFHIEIDGANVSGTMAVPDTDSFDAFTTVSQQIALTAGRQVVRFVFDAPGATGYGAAYDWMRISAT